MPQTTLHTDSTAAISLVSRPQVSERNKNTEIKAHHFKDLISQGTILLEYISSIKQPADLLTKILSEHTLQELLPLFTM